jgi:hypothetical protein
MLDKTGPPIPRTANDPDATKATVSRVSGKDAVDRTLSHSRRSERMPKQDQWPDRRLLRVQPGRGVGYRNKGSALGRVSIGAER